LLYKYNNSTKTLGPRAAQLISELYERRRLTFNLSDVALITGLSPAAARNLVHKAVTRGLVTRLKPGLFTLVPFELGRATEYVDNPYLIARELAANAPYYVSHASAFELHRMLTQPNLIIYVSCTRRLRSQRVGGYDFRFIHLRAEPEFGLMQYWIDKQRFVMVSDRERSIIDGLCQPAFIGGITEIAKGLWMQRDALNVKRLIDYAQRLDNGALVRRLGYLLDHLKLAEAVDLARLRSRLSATYQRLDPILPAQGPCLARWRVQLNVSPDEISAARNG
jgi:predicted transcriptional regulator of viral defense system